jgi:ferredoxin
VHRTRPGTLLHLEQAAGDFVLPPVVETPTKLLFVTAGSGVTPVVGMLRNLFPSTDEGILRPVRSRHLDIVVLHVAPREPDSIFLRDLQNLDRVGAIRLVARYDDVHGLLDALQEHHDQAGLPLQTEQFRPTVLVTGEGGEVTFGRSGTVVEADGSTPILVAGEDAGVLMPSGCRMGVCYSCVTPLLSGAVRDLRSGDLTTAVPGETDPGGVLVQTCINAAAGPCTFDI